MRDLVQPGDFYRIATPRMCASGEIVKVNRTTFDWRARYFYREVRGRLALTWLHRATVFRESEQRSFSIL